MEIVSIISITLVAGIILLCVAALIGAIYNSAQPPWAICLYLIMFLFLGYIVFTFLIGMYRDAFGLPYFFWEWEPLPKEGHVTTDISSG